MPDGLVASRAVLTEFLDPPDERGDWFSNEAWQQASLLLRDDGAITDEEYTDMIVHFNRLQDALIAWAKARPDMSKGYAETLSDGDRRTMSYALRWIWSMNRPDGRLAKLSAKDGLESETKTGIDNFGQVLWEYFQCMAFELDASHDQIPVTVARSRFMSETDDTWEPAVTPDNVESGGLLIGGHRLPPAPEPPAPEPTGSGDPGTADPGTGDPVTPDPGTGDPGTGDPGGEGGGGEE
jgi:hypothetical protein